MTKIKIGGILKDEGRKKSIYLLNKVYIRSFKMKEYIKAGPLCPVCDGNLLKKWDRDEDKKEYMYFQCLMCGRVFEPIRLDNIRKIKDN